MQENVTPSFGRRMKKILEVMVPILITQPVSYTHLDVYKRQGFLNGGE